MSGGIVRGISFPGWPIIPLDVCVSLDFYARESQFCCCIIGTNKPAMAHHHGPQRKDVLIRKQLATKTRQGYKAIGTLDNTGYQSLVPINHHLHTHLPIF